MITTSALVVLVSVAAPSPEDAGSVETTSSPTRALRVGGSGGIDVALQDFGGAAVGSGGANVALQLKRFEAGLEVGGVAFGPLGPDTSWGLDGVETTAFVGYRAPLADVVFMPLRARGGILAVTSDPSAADLAVVLGLGLGLGFHVASALDVEWTFFNFDAYFWSNEFGGLEASLAAGMGLRLTYGFAL
jgi:hypothetical protein